ncbi:hypothetical protein D1007_07767 [Hordeum vulgare]|nr:hypothetical protein D1007_07767 [Hordeum vulgare]
MVVVTTAHGRCMQRLPTLGDATSHNLQRHRRSPPARPHLKPRPSTGTLRRRPPANAQGDGGVAARRGSQPAVGATDPSGCTTRSSTNRPEHGAFQRSPVEATT